MPRVITSELIFFFLVSGVDCSISSKQCSITYEHLKAWLCHTFNYKMFYYAAELILIFELGKCSITVNLIRVSLQSYSEHYIYVLLLLGMFLKQAKINIKRSWIRKLFCTKILKVHAFNSLSPKVLIITLTAEWKSAVFDSFPPFRKWMFAIQFCLSRFGDELWRTQ